LRAGISPGLTQTGSLAIYDAVQANRHAEAAGMVAVLSAVAIAALFLGNRLTQKRPHVW
jgi:molybdate transport system permease protein